MKEDSQKISLKGPTRFQQNLAVGMLLLKMSYFPEISLLAVVVVLAGHLIAGAAFIGIIVLTNFAKGKETP